MEGFKVRHPFLREGSVLNVGFVEDKDHGKFGLVEDAAGVEHVAHECAGRVGARGVDHVGDYGGEAGGQGVEEDASRGAPDEDFDLARSVDEDVLYGFGIGGFRVWSGAFFEEVKNLVDFGGEEIERGKDTAVGAQVVLFHYFFVVYRVPDVDVAVEGDGADGGVKVYYVWG